MPFAFPPCGRTEARCCPKYQKLVLKALQWWMPWAQEPIFLNLLDPETGLGVASKNINVFFQRACMLNKIHKIEVKSSQTLDARASGFYFPTPSWAWNWPWEWYQKISIMVFQRYFTLNTIPYIHVFILWRPEPQDSIFKHSLESEGGPEGNIKTYQKCIF